MKSILVATDLSARSDWAIERAAKLAAYHDCRLVVLHVVDEELPARVADRLRDEAAASLKEFVSGLEPAQIVKIETRCEFGEHFSTIIDAAEKESADLIVIGKHREDALLDLFRGSTGERIIRFGSRPVLVVKQRPSHGYHNVMVAVDFSPASAIAVEFGASLVPNARLQVVHAFHIPFKGFLHGGKSFDRMARRQQQEFNAANDREISSFFATLKIDLSRAERIVEEGTAHEVILGAVRNKKPDLLVLGTHGRSGLGRSILGSVAEAVLSQAPCDVLAVRG